MINTGRLSRNLIARWGTFTPAVRKTVQTTILRHHPDILDQLADAQHLDDSVVSALYAKKPPTAWTANRLLGRPLSGKARQLVLEKERRSGPLQILLQYNRLTDQEWHTLTRKGSVATARVLLEQPELPVNLRRELSAKLPAGERLVDIGNAPVDAYTDQDVLATLKQVAETANGKAVLVRELRNIFYRRHQLARTVLDAVREENGELAALHRGVSLAIAGIPGIAQDILVGISGTVLRDVVGLGHALTWQANTLARLVANPSTPQAVRRQIVEQVDPSTRQMIETSNGKKTEVVLNIPELVGPVATAKDPVILETLADLTRRGNPWLMVDIVLNPNTPDTILNRLKLGLINRRVQAVHVNADALIERGIPVAERTATVRGRYVPPSLVTTLATIEMLGEKLGDDQDRWQTLLALVDDFDGSADELTETVLTL